MTTPLPRHFLLLAAAGPLALLAPASARAQSFATTTGPMRGTVAGEMKVSEDLLAYEGSPVFDTSGNYLPLGAYTCDPNNYPSGAGWPMTTAELDHYYHTTTPTSGGVPTAEPNYTIGVWALNDANSTATVLELTNQNLYVADVGNKNRVVHTWGEWAAVDHCNWQSWAALNDVLQYRVDNDPLQPMIYTGAALEVGGEDLRNRWACTYRDYINRARQERFAHPEIVRVIYFDELWRLMVGPEAAVWQNGAHWTTDNVDHLAQMVRDGVYLGQDVNAHGLTDANCPSTYTMADTTTTPGGLDLELWSRMFSPGIPRYVVPSSILGVAADPATLDGNPGDTTAYGFSDDDTLSVRWNGLSSSGVTFPAAWRVELEFLYADGDIDSAADQDLVLSASVNGTQVFTTSLNHKETSEVHLATACLLSSAPGCGSAWVRGALGNNNVKVELTTAKSPTDLSVDRIAYVWAVRVNYVNEITGNVFWSTGYLDPDPASATYSTSDGTVAGTLGTTALARSNADAAPYASGWLITEHLDGVAVTQTHSSTQFDSTAFDRLMEHTCDYMQAGFATEKGCLVDEAGAAFGNGDNYTTIHAAYPTEDAWYRMNAADTWGDGVISYFLPLSLENVGLNAGRYTERDILDPTYTSMVYEPRQTRSLIGEVQEWSWTVPAGCGGTYQIDRELFVEADAPELWWFVDHEASGIRNREDDGQVDSLPTTPTTGSTPVYALPGEVLWVGWSSRGAGGSVDHTNNVHFALDASSSPCTPAGTGTSWSHSTRFNDDSGSSRWSGSTLSAAEALYECILRYYDDPIDAGNSHLDDCK